MTRPASAEMHTTVHDLNSVLSEFCERNYVVGFIADGLRTSSQPRTRRIFGALKVGELGFQSIALLHLQALVSEHFDFGLTAVICCTEAFTVRNRIAPPRLTIVWALMVFDSSVRMVICTKRVQFCTFAELCRDFVHFRASHCVRNSIGFVQKGPDRAALRHRALR